MWSWIGKLLKRGWRAYSEFDTVSSLLANFGVTMTGGFVTLWGYFAGLPGPILIVILLAMLSVTLLTVVTWLGWWRAAETKAGPTDGVLGQASKGERPRNELHSVRHTDIEDISIPPRHASIGLVPNMDMRQAVALAADSTPEALGNDLDRLNDALTLIRQLAHQGEIQIWEKRITDPSSFAYLNTWSEIPRDYWETKEISPLVLDGAAIGPHTIVDEAAVHLRDRQPDYCAARVNREQFERVIGKIDPENLGAVLKRYLDEGWELFNRVSKRRPDYRIVNLDGQTQHDIMEWNRKVELILEDSGMRKAKRSFRYYKLKKTGELRARVARLEQILNNDLGNS